MKAVPCECRATNRRTPLACVNMVMVADDHKPDPLMPCKCHTCSAGRCFWPHWVHRECNPNDIEGPRFIEGKHTDEWRQLQEELDSESRVPSLEDQRIIRRNAALAKQRDRLQRQREYRREYTARKKGT